MLVEDAVFRQLLVVWNFGVSNLIQIHQLESEHIHFLKEWLDFRFYSRLGGKTIRLNLLFLESEFVDL